MTTGPEIKNFDLYITDQNQDGDIDLITLMDQENEIFEMFTFSKGYLEPVPEQLIIEIRKDGALGLPKLVALINKR